MKFLDNTLHRLAVPTPKSATDLLILSNSKNIHKRALTKRYAFADDLIWEFYGTLYLMLILKNPFLIILTHSSHRQQKILSLGNNRICMVCRVKFTPQNCLHILPEWHSQKLQSKHLLFSSKGRGENDSEIFHTLP